ncbi:hypothetical protein [Staphylococcus carnosus]|uniref:Uncharacterized protein n=1 Tax=Staphylococcus carnosus (strain TM300) TaxID=396513 RepID=B9DJ64_STACT|nr:hypothetical protein [Staphylococcus carnosus]KOR12532.1 hypothetical protein AMC75_08615 [Staphylococcus carnosus]QPT02949.1 hypothetical protein I6G40_07435 [Staphylococcus carnosus]UQA67953.1 hypothetical protein Sta3580_03465 [Staphylococcus carnosus]UTB77228.1 hypothetical protein A2I62_00935 [Staphylococcus carnosus]UTB86772.1 hypothetical protein A2I63_00925 [Staphylococcus carnosus]
MSNDNHEKSLEEINQEIEEELRNYNPKEDEEKKQSIIFTKPRLLVIIIVLCLGLYRILHFFF